MNLLLPELKDVIVNISFGVFNILLTAMPDVKFYIRLINNSLIFYIFTSLIFQTI